MKTNNTSSYRVPAWLRTVWVGCIAFLAVATPVKAQNHWTADISHFDNYMAITAYVVRNDVELRSSQIEVAAFVDNQCRGTILLKDVGVPLDGHSFLAFLQVWGSSDDNGKAITFQVYDPVTIREYEAEQKPEYRYNESLGIDTPYKITILQMSSITINTAANGTLTANKSAALPGETITLTAHPDQGYETERINIVPATVTITGSDNNYSFVMPGSDVTLTPVFKKSADQIAVETAKALIEAGSYTVAQAVANTEATVKAWLVTQINALGGMSATGIAVTATDITLSDCTPAVTGTESNQGGTNGSFIFTVRLTKGASSLTTANKTGVITATPYTPPGMYLVTIAAMPNGTVTATPSGAVEAETLITLTITPDTGYELNTITACKTEDPETVVTLSGSDNQRTFTMPAYNVTVTATFRKPSGQEDVEIAREAVEKATYTVKQVVANTESTVRKWLEGQINALLQQGSSGVTVKEADIAITSFTAAIKGTEADNDGTNGSFTFSVILTKGSYSVTTSAIEGTITAAPYGVAIEDASTNTWRVVSTGNGLLVTGLIPGETLRVYDLQGRLLFEQRITFEEQAVSLTNHGIYIVTSGKRRVKVLH